MLRKQRNGSTGRATFALPSAGHVIGTPQSSARSSDDGFMTTPAAPSSAVSEALRKFFAAHCKPALPGGELCPKSFLDMDRFMSAQDALRAALGEQKSSSLAMNCFLELANPSYCSETCFSLFSRQQLKLLMAKGMTDSQIVDVIKRGLEWLGLDFGHISTARSTVSLEKYALEKIRIDIAEAQKKAWRMLHKDEAEHKGGLRAHEFQQCMRRTSSSPNGLSNAKMEIESTLRNFELTSFEQASGGLKNVHAGLADVQLKQLRKDGKENQAAMRSQPLQQATLRTLSTPGNSTGTSKVAMGRTMQDFPPRSPALKRSQGMPPKQLRLPENCCGLDGRARPLVDARAEGGGGLSHDCTHMSLGASLNDQKRFQELACHGRDAPKTCSTSMEDLVKYLVEPTCSETERAWVIFAWVCYHVAYDVDGLHGRTRRKSCNAHDVLRNCLSVCAGYSNLFEELAKLAALTVRQVVGDARTISEKVGQDVKKKGVGGHAWNAVKLDGKWILVDCTWGAGTCTNIKFERDFRPHFFGTHPDALAFSHFPEDASWQLKAKALSYHTFIDLPIVSTAGFFSHGLCFVPKFHPSGTITKGSTVALKAPADTFFLVLQSGEKVGVSQKRDSGSGIVTISLDEHRGSKLEIFVRKGSPYGNFEYACSFAIEQVCRSGMD